MDGENRQWHRRHVNRWFAMVMLDEDGQFSYGAESSDPAQVSERLAPFKVASSLEAAQQAADAAVPKHRCGDACREWREGPPTTMDSSTTE